MRSDSTSVMTNMDKLQVILISVIAAAVVTGFELISLAGTDNLFIPLGVFYIINRLSGYPLPVYINTLLQFGFSVLIIAIITAWNQHFRPGWKISMALFLFASFALCGNVWPYSTLAFIVILTGWIYYFNNKGIKEDFEVTPALKIGILPVIPLFFSAALNNYQLLFPVFITSLCSSGILHIHEFLSIRNREGRIQKRLQKIIIFSFSVFISFTGILAVPALFFPNAENWIQVFILSLSGTFISSVVYFLLMILSGKDHLKEKPVINLQNYRFYSVLAGTIFCLALSLLNTKF